MLHRLCGPQINSPLSFNRLRSYSPGGVLNAFAAALKGETTPTLSTHRLRRGLPGYLILLLPTLSSLSVSYEPESRLRHWCSSIYLRISPLRRIPLSSSCTPSPVSNDPPRLGKGLSTSDLEKPPALALRPINPDNACHLHVLPRLLA